MPSDGVHQYTLNGTQTWPEGTDEILLEGLNDVEMGYRLAFERMQKLNPKLRAEAIRKRLQPKARELQSIWAASSFWQQELDIALIGGILGGAEARRATVERIHQLWPALDPQMLRDRLEAIADQGIPIWAKSDFWKGTLKQILLQGILGRTEAERKAMDKVLRLHKELRHGVVSAQLRRLKDERRRAEERSKCKFSWTTGLLCQLQEACDMLGLEAAISHMQSQTGWPSHIIRRKARRFVPIGETTRSQTPWAASEQRYLIENASHMSTREMAKELNRSVESVACKMKHLGLPTGREQGYTISRLAREWHVRRTTVKHWIQVGWLKLGKDGRVAERVLRSFCKSHRDQLNWDKLDVYTQGWVLEFVHSEEGVP